MRADLVDVLWQRRLTLRQLACAVSELKCLAAEIRLERAMRRHGLALRIVSKAGFKPDQPRVPKGDPDGGQWTADGGGGQGSSKKPEASRSPVKLAGDITGFTRHGINQAISRGVPPGSIRDAVVNPIQIVPQSNGTTRYIGKHAVVVLNPAGGIVTVWRR